MTKPQEASRLRVALAWAVHAFTASGALAGVAAILCISAAEPRKAILWMLLALFIDSVDGMAARAVGVSKVLPRFDGRRLDDMVDFFNYVLVPAVFLVSGGLVVHWSVVCLPILASAFGFSQLDAKTDDDFFLGFPSYWNVLVIYIWLLELGPVAASMWVTFFAALVFVPFKYLYPSRMKVLWNTNFVLLTVCALLVGYAVIDPARARALYLVEASLVYPIFYFTLSLWLGGIHRPLIARRRLGQVSPKPMSKPKTGILLVNIGTPDSPRVGDVRRYLREFLSDPPVLGLSPLARFALLNFVILPLRPRRSAHAYRQIWLPEGSPLLVHSRALASAVAAELGPSYSVGIGMRYGNPSIREGLDALCRAGVEGIIALPMFPQYSEAATGSAASKVREEHGLLAKAPPLVLLDCFFADPGFIAAVAAVARERLEAFRPDHVLMSFHGLPEEHVRGCRSEWFFLPRREELLRSTRPGESPLLPRPVLRDCPPARCGSRCGEASTTSRFSRDSDERPGSDPTPKSVSPSFAPMASSAWRCCVRLSSPTVSRPTKRSASARRSAGWTLGGEDFLLVPSLNHHPAWATAVAAMVRAAAPQNDSKCSGVKGLASRCNRQALEALSARAA